MYVRKVNGFWLEACRLNNFGSPRRYVFLVVLVRNDPSLVQTLLVEFTELFRRTLESAKIVSNEIIDVFSID